MPTLDLALGLGIGNAENAARPVDAILNEIVDGRPGLFFAGTLKGFELGRIGIDTAL